MGVAGNSGQCCECNQLSGCDCEVTVPCNLSCRAKGGDATLIGYQEFCEPADPPKRYRTKTFFGNNPISAYADEGCSGSPTGSANPSQSGALSYDRITGELTNTTVFADGGGPVESGTDVCEEYESCESILSVSATGLSITGRSACCLVAGSWRTAGGMRGEALSEEDTEGDAEARARAAISEWESCADCSVLCSSYRSDRSGTSDVVFGFRTVQTKCTWEAEIGATYNVVIKFARRSLSSGGPFLELGMQYESIVSAGLTTESTPWIDVPNEAAWETIALACVVTLIP